MNLRSTRYYLWILLPVLLAIFLSGCYTYVSQNAGQTFQNRTKGFSVTVYPVNVVKSDRIINDSQLAGELVVYLQQERLATPVPGEKNFSYAFQWGSNQAKMHQRTAQAFAAQVKRDQIGTDYALLVEILTNALEDQVYAVSYYLVDKSGNVADGTLANADRQAFRDVSPTGRQSALQVIYSLLKTNWKK